MMNLDICSPDVNTLLARFSTRSDPFKSVAIGPRPVRTEFFGDTHPRTPVLPPCSGRGHHRFDPHGIERCCDFLHLPCPPLTVNNYTAHHVIRQALPVDSWEAFVER